MHAVGGCEVEFVAGLHAEEVVPGIDVAHDAVDALATQRMGVGLVISEEVAIEDHLGEVRAVLLAIVFSIGNEVACLLPGLLFARESALLEIAGIGVEGYLHAAQVGNVLTQAERAAALLAGYHHDVEFVEAVYEFLAELVEGCLVGRIGEKVCQVAPLVVPTAIAVESVGDFVAHRSKQDCIVEGLVLLGIV